jgi:SAM-dependent methyltransferase
MEKEQVLDKALSFDFGGMSRGEVSFLYDFCKGKMVLELGSMVGMSSFVIASVCESITCVDIWNDTFEHVTHRQREVYENLWTHGFKMVDMFQNNCKEFLESGKMKMVRGKTGDVYNRFDGKKFDLVMIDADHEYEGVRDDIENYIDKVGEEGYLLFHDYGCTMWTGVQQACEEFVEKGRISLVKTEERIAIFTVKK